jgi:hypothetical protein
MIGPKPGKERIEAMMLSPEDLPEAASWKIHRSNSMRAGARILGSARARRTRRAGSISGYRSFADFGTKRQLWVQITPFACSSDAEYAAPTTLKRMILSSGSKTLRVIEDWHLDPKIEVVGLSNVQAWECQHEGPSGRGLERLLAGSVGEVLIVINLTQYGQMKPWDYLTGLAAVQAEKVRDVLSKTSIGP